MTQAQVFISFDGNMMITRILEISTLLFNLGNSGTIFSQI